MGTAALVAALAGCATQPPGSALRQGPRMIDLYRGGAVEAAPEDEPTAADAQGRCRWWLFTWPCEAAAGEPDEEPVARPSYARTAANELELLFPRLPNPDVYIYLTPHLATGERVPVPGYTTAVPLYDRVEYALPGESPGDGESP